MKPSIETKRFWLMLYAMDSFHHVVTACDHLIENNTQHDAPLYRLLATAILTMYGRPFHNNRGVGKLDEVIVPAEFMDLHRQLILERDKIHAHVDSVGIT